MRLLLSTGNMHKAREISQILAPHGIGLMTLKDFPEAPEVVEDGRTIEENARKKAVEVARATRQWTLADDTGLEVEALGGAPGVHAARYAGEGCDFAANVAKLIRELEGVGESGRGALFRCVMALSSPEGEVVTREGRLPGRILGSSAGGNGFGYDPVFFVPELGKTLAEVGAEEKNRVSHRGRALRAIASVIREKLA